MHLPSQAIRNISSKGFSPAMSREELHGLRTLPIEIQLNIAAYLDYGSLLALRRTNRHLREVVDRVGCSDAEKSSFVRAAEQYPRHANNLGCYCCYRVLPASKFADEQTYGKGNWKTFSRFCLECGVKMGRYSPGVWVVKNGVDMICCRKCRRVRAIQFCSICWRCSSCLGLPVSETSHKNAAKEVVNIMMSLSLFRIDNRIDQHIRRCGLSRMEVSHNSRQSSKTLK